MNGSDIFINPIPVGDSVTWTKIYDAAMAGTVSAEIKAKINLPDTLIHETNFPDIEVYEDSTGVILRYVRVPTTAIPNTEVNCPNNKQVPQSYIIPGRSDTGAADPNKNVLHDTIQSNVEQYVDGNEELQKPYNYELFDTTATKDIILPGEKGGNFIVDVKNGVINFTDIESTEEDGGKGTISSRLDNKPPTISFHKYNGLKGISSVIQSSADGTNTFEDVSANNIQTNRIAIGKYFSEMENGILLDLCGQRMNDEQGGSAIILPKGLNSDRPWQNGEEFGGDTAKLNNAAGALRYNVENKQFEGYSSNAWQGLGGVTDIEQQSRVTASYDSTTPGQDRRLRFFVDGSLNMVFDGSGNIAMGYNYDADDQTLQDTGFKGTDVSFNNNVNVSVHADMSMNGMFYNTGGMDIDAEVSLTGDLTQVGNIDLTGDITQTGNLDILTGDFKVKDSNEHDKFILTNAGKIDMSGALTTHGAADLKSTLTVDGVTLLKDRLDLSGALTST